MYVLQEFVRSYRMKTGARNAAWRHLELHHITPRAELGGHQAENLVVMCWTHHEMLHRGIIGVQRGPEGQPS